jgi:glycosyltransferase involved in cell wall biosynthesis
MSNRPLICGFLKVRNEVIREGNIHRVLANMERYCDAAVICDDASSDGTREIVAEWCTRLNDPLSVGAFRFFSIKPEEQNFRNELAVKQRMLDVVHQIKPHFVMWMDGDETLDRMGTGHLRTFCEGNLSTHIKAWRFHYTQFWRGTRHARTDEGFDDGHFIKLWRYSPDLTFDVREGTHHAQFPLQIMAAFYAGQIADAPFECLHYGNYGTNLRWKVIQYRHGLGGWERHLRFHNGIFRVVDQDIIPFDCERDPQPAVAFTPLEIERIKELGNLRDLEDRARRFAVIIPAYNRADTLPRALQSLLDQTYDRWIAIVLDDGSKDDTQAVMREWQDKDPRIFYCRYNDNRGGVAMNEIGMQMACDMAEWWTRLGSDDWFGPNKLMNDAFALAGHEACFGVYQVERDGTLMEYCNGPAPSDYVQRALLRGTFMASWANVAVRTSVLKRVKEKYGNFCDPALRNMEDFLVNVRIAREAKFVFRCRFHDGTIIVDPTEQMAKELMNEVPNMPLDALWRAVTTGASGNSLQTMQDENTTRALITKENIAHFGRPA